MVISDSGTQSIRKSAWGRPRTSRWLFEENEGSVESTIAVNCLEDAKQWYFENINFSVRKGPQESVFHVVHHRKFAWKAWYGYFWTNAGIMREPFDLVLVEYWGRLCDWKSRLKRQNKEFDIPELRKLSTSKRIWFG